MPMKKQKTTYVDGFVLLVPKKNLVSYRRMAKGASTIWMKHGAIDYKECVADDMYPDMGNFKILRFPDMAKAKKDEVVVFSYITYKSRKHRDQVNAKVMKDPAMNDPKYANMKMPFDMKKMAYGGFKVLVDGTL
jgi:uncharacterized protein YbaA (DUF1428 family)